jgi:hypothetical protein
MPVRLAVKERGPGAESARPKKMAPLLGPQLKEAKWKVESGMAKRRAVPAAGKATREMTQKTESEGHLSAASFGTYLSAFAQPKPPSPAVICRNFGKPLQDNHLERMTQIYQRNSQAGVVRCGMQNPAHSLHSLTLGNRTAGTGRQTSLDQGLMSGVRSLRSDVRS